MAGKSVNIFVLNWNGKAVSSECLKSLNNLSYKNKNVIFIDNGSTDNSVSYIKKKYPQLKIIELKKNYGFGGGNNLGFEKADRADYSIFLNNDTVVDSDFIEPLLSALEESPRAMQSSPKIFYESKKSTIWFAGGNFNLWTSLIRHTGLRKKDSPNYGRKMLIDYATGCCVCMRSEDFNKIGKFDTTFSMYGEDVDLSMRFRLRGGKVIFAPNSIVWHKVSASIGGEFSFRKLFLKQVAKIRLMIKYVNFLKLPSFIICGVLLFIFEYLLSLLFFQTKK